MGSIVIFAAAAFRCHGQGRGPDGGHRLGGAGPRRFGRGAGAAAAAAEPGARRRALSGAAGLGVAYAFGVVDRLAAWYACYDLSERLGAAVRVGSLASALSRTSGAVVAGDVALAMAAGFPGGGDALEVGAAEVEFDLRRSVETRGLVVTSAKLRDVRVVVARHASGLVNFQLLDAAARKAFYAAREAEAAPEAPAAPERALTMEEMCAAAAAEAEEEEAAEVAAELQALHAPPGGGGGAGAGAAVGAAADLASAGLDAAVALSALDASRSAREAVGGAVESTQASAATWARNTVSAKLKAWLESIMTGTDGPPVDPPSFLYPGVTFVGAVHIDNLTVELVAPDGSAVLAPPLVLEEIVATRFALKKARADDALAPPERVLLRCLKALIDAGIADICESRLDEARRIAVNVGSAVTKEAVALPKTAAVVAEAKTVARRGSVMIAGKRLVTRAAVCEAFGAPVVVRDDWALPPLAPTSVHVRCEAAGLNFAEALQLKGEYQEKLEPPFVPGNECAGVVVAVGAAVSRCVVGDAVLALPRGGAWARDVVVPEAAVAPPKRRRPWSRGGDAKLRLALDRGAAAGVVYGGTDAREFRAALREAAPEGIDVAVDMVGGDFLEPIVRSLAFDGRCVVVGFASGTIPKIPANLLLVKNCALVGLFWGAHAIHRPAVFADSLRNVVGLWRAGDIAPHVSATYALADADAAVAALVERRSSGKIVLAAA
ncbi:oxidoreductase [Aureococcus anophagefferens]|nr:oxidoreductase [Aureococcus anophagefferens]